MTEVDDIHQYPREGEVIEEKYRIEKVLGTGGMGAVIAATHVLRQAPVALKFMSPDLVNTPGVVERFLNEGVAASRIDNDHVVNVLDVSRLPTGLPYLVMEFLRGEDLSGLIAREGRHGLTDIPRAVHIALQVLRGLQAAHDAGIIHRDLKPANCFVMTRDGEPDFIKIVDFGISKVREQQSAALTMAGSMLGSPLYISPEQARDSASVDNRADIYGVAIILYELLCGHPPFNPQSGQLSELFIMVATQAPPSLDALRQDLPQGLNELVLRGLSKSPDERPQTPVEMAEALSAYADERSDVVLRQLLPRRSMLSQPASGYRFEATEVLGPGQPGGSPSVPASKLSSSAATGLSASVVDNATEAASNFNWLKLLALAAASLAIIGAAVWATPQAAPGEPLAAPGKAESLGPNPVQGAAPRIDTAPIDSGSIDTVPPDRGAAERAADEHTSAIKSPVVTPKVTFAPAEPVTENPNSNPKQTPTRAKAKSKPAAVKRTIRRRTTPSLNDIGIEQ